MQIVVLASRKGGAGKTTIAAHLAVEADRQKAGPVAVVDLDPMGGLATWWNRREAATPYFGSVADKGLDAALGELEGQGIKLVVIDTPPAASQAIGEIIERATVVIAPVVPSPHDLSAINETMMLIEARRRPLIFAINNAGVRTVLLKQAIETLRLVCLARPNPKLYSVSPAVLHTRQEYRSSMIDGRTVGEIASLRKKQTKDDRYSQAAGEVESLWAFVSSQMKEELHGAAAAA